MLGFFVPGKAIHSFCSKGMDWSAVFQENPIEYMFLQGNRLNSLIIVTLLRCTKLFKNTWDNQPKLQEYLRSMKLRESILTPKLYGCNKNLEIQSSLNGSCKDVISLIYAFRCFSKHWFAFILLYLLCHGKWCIFNILLIVNFTNNAVEPCLGSMSHQSG